MKRRFDPREIESFENESPLTRMNAKEYAAIRLKENCFPLRSRMSFYIPVAFKTKVFRNLVPDVILVRLIRSISYLERRSGREFSETLPDASATIWYLNYIRSKQVAEFSKLLCEGLSSCIERSG